MMHSYKMTASQKTPAVALKTLKKQVHKKTCFFIYQMLSLKTAEH